LTSILALQNELARAIVGRIDIALRAEEPPPEQRRKVNPETYEAYL